MEMQIIGPNDEIIETVPGRPDEFNQPGASPAGAILETACFGN